MNPLTQAWLPDLIYVGGSFRRDVVIVCEEGSIVRLAPADEVENPVRLRNRALLPGLINAHSHAFQRLLRGRTEHRTSNQQDSFWTWRELMYRTATRLAPEDVYDASRMAFLEMALGGITAVGEFHYLHHAPDGAPYDDPNLIAKEVVRAANDVGLRIALLHVAYARSGFQTGANPRQARFIESDVDVYLQRVEALKTDLKRGDQRAWIGLAPHSVRAVPLPYLKAVAQYAHEQALPLHMHVAEQQAEVSACIAEYGRSPVALLETEGILSEHFTAVHAIHVTPKAIKAIAQARAIVCACPTTERNLGDGVVPADQLFDEGVRVSLGTDSHTQIDLLEDARELEYHLRLQKMQRVMLAQTGDEGVGALAARLFDCATVNGAQSIGAPGGALVPGSAADFFTVDLNDPTIAGASENDLRSAIVFSSSRAAVREVVVGGKQIVADGRHDNQEQIVERFNSLQTKIAKA
jgi:formimidoylglutamate deiminase